MSLLQTIFTGSKQAYDVAEIVVKSSIEELGRDCKVAFPDTAYSLPLYYASTGRRVSTLGELEEALETIKGFIVEKNLLANGLDAGYATALCAEVIEAVKYARNEDPYRDEPGYGFVSDAQIRSYGVGLVTQDIPGVAVLLGKAEDSESAAKIIKDYQAKGLLTYLVGDIIDQAIQHNVKMGNDLRVIPLGYDVTSVIHVVSIAIRAALIFGGIEPGKSKEFYKYTKERVKAFVNAFGPLSELVVSAGAGAIQLGFPVICDTVVPEVPTYLLSQRNHEKTVQTSLEARGIKIKVTEIPIPVSFAAAFEGERIRKDSMYAEFGGSKTKSWELVMTRDISEIEDHKIEVIGPDIDSFNKVPGRLPLSVIVEVAGKKMEEDFEPVLERRLHYFMNYIEGVMHVGQRNLTWIRIGKDAFEKGFRLRHIGEVIYAKMHDEFEAVVDKCQVTIITDEEKVKELEKKYALPKYEARDERLDALIDESVDTFYSCNLCQSFAPAHVCIITPERLGLCGAVSWLDAKATKELDEHGPCQPVLKEGLEDSFKGVWSEVNKVVEQISQGAVSRVTLYSLIEDPMTSCGCFECICGIMPEANGVVIVNREYGGMSPVGMTFGELAAMTGGGVQTPGFMGHGRHFISSKKFISAEGGVKRIVWMPKELKEFIAQRLNATVKELYNIENFTDMVCDETIAVDSEEVMNFLSEKGHPALNMDSIM
ncbi:MAG: CO dehydrogenase/CO-methylating acetyl-CoA synthase complex subunit beta [Clostridia bacterium]|nr:CO dehydrogenase/CO-methylating acetyl-CoA synthase complex subunit beta [Clostridia bacterium]